MKHGMTALAVLSVAGSMAISGAAALAQEAESAPETSQGTGAETAPQSEEGAAQQDAQQDALVATVGETEIRESDIEEEISALPADVRELSPDVLVPAVLDQLILRELAVNRARAENLAEDPEVQAITEESPETSEQDALAAIWLQRQVSERVTQADVDAAIEEMKAANPDVADQPDLAPQVEQVLQVQALEEISQELREDAEITLYGPAGEAVDQIGGGAGEQQTETQ